MMAPCAWHGNSVMRRGVVVAQPFARCDDLHGRMFFNCISVLRIRCLRFLMYGSVGCRFFSHSAYSAFNPSSLSYFFANLSLCNVYRSVVTLLSYCRRFFGGRFTAAG